jgi:hypothetical protein
VISTHAETLELFDCRNRITDLATELGCELSDADHEAVSRFAQLLFERSRKQKGTHSAS